MTRGILFSIGFTLLLAGCGGGAPAASSPPPPSVAVASQAAPASAKPAASPVASAAANPSAAAGGAASLPQRWNDIINKRDTSGAIALFTDDAVITGSPLCTVRTPCKGSAGAEARVKAAVDRHAEFLAPSSAPAVVGNLVQWKLEFRNDATRGAGLDRGIDIITATLRGDKIALLSEFADVSDAQEAKIQAYQQQQAAASAAAKPAASGAAAADPGAVVTTWIDALNRGDAAGAAAVWASDGVMAAGRPCSLATPCTGGAIQASFQGSIGSHTQYTLVGSPIVVGNLVQVRREIRNDDTKASGADRFVDWHQETVLGGKLATDLGNNDLSDAQTVKYIQWQQATASAVPAASAVQKS